MKKPLKNKPKYYRLLVLCLVSCCLLSGCKKKPIEVEEEVEVDTSDTTIIPAASLDYTGSQIQGGVNGESDALNNDSEIVSSDEPFQSDDVTDTSGVSDENRELGLYIANEQMRELEVENYRHLDGDVAGGWSEPTTNHYYPSDATISMLMSYGIELFKNAYNQNNMVIGLWTQFLSMDTLHSKTVQNSQNEIRSVFGLNTKIDTDEKSLLAEKFKLQHEMDQRGSLFVVSNPEKVPLRYWGRKLGFFDIQYKEEQTDDEILAETGILEDGSQNLSFDRTDVNFYVGQDYSHLLFGEEISGRFLCITANGFEVSWQNEASYYVTHQFQNVETQFAHYGETLSVVEDEAVVGVIKQFNYGHYDFVVLMPKVDIEVFVSDFTADYYESLMDSAAKQSVNIFVPKFKQYSEIDMMPVWKHCGITGIFEQSDLWLGLTNKEQYLQIDEIRHRAYISMNGRGARAYETIEDVRTEDAIDEVNGEKIWFDQPFLYMVVDHETQIPVMMGVVKTL